METETGIGRRYDNSLEAPTREIRKLENAFVIA